MQEEKERERERTNKECKIHTNIETKTHAHTHTNKAMIRSSQIDQTIKAKDTKPLIAIKALQQSPEPLTAIKTRLIKLEDKASKVRTLR